MGKKKGGKGKKGKKGGKAKNMAVVEKKFEEEEVEIKKTPLYLIEG